MKLRYVIESIVFAALLLAVWIGWQVVQGMIVTKAYKPNIAEQYTNVEYLEERIAFGAAAGAGGWTYMVVAFAALAVFYYGVRKLHADWKRKYGK